MIAVPFVNLSDVAQLVVSDGGLCKTSLRVINPRLTKLVLQSQTPCLLPVLFAD